MLFETCCNLQLLPADKTSNCLRLVKGHSKVKSLTHMQQKRNIKSCLSLGRSFLTIGISFKTPNIDFVYGF